MIQLPKEQCMCCQKFIYFGQSILECELCSSIIHTKCFKLSKFNNIENLWHCELCAKKYVPRYNPFLSSTNSDSEAFYNENPSDAIDLMQKMSSILVNCKSYDKNEFNELTDGILLEDTSIFSSYFLNIDGNLSNFDEFAIEMNGFNHAFSVIGLAETNCNPLQKDLYPLSNYNNFYQNIQEDKKKGTGVALYVHKSLNASVENQFCYNNELIETLFLSITNTPDPMVVCVIYRPPSGQIDEFMKILSTILETMPNKPVYIMGDFNLDLLNKSNKSVNEYEQLLLTSCFAPCISVHTHEKPGCRKTCIDNIHTNNSQNIITSGTISDRLSHHSPIFQLSHMKNMNTHSEKKSIYSTMIILILRLNCLSIDWLMPQKNSNVLLISLNLMKHLLKLWMIHVSLKFQKYLKEMLPTIHG